MVDNCTSYVLKAHRYEKGQVEILQVRIGLTYPDCSACPFFKSRRSAVKSQSSEHRSVVDFELWNSDYKGPFAWVVTYTVFCIDI